MKLLLKNIIKPILLGSVLLPQLASADIALQPAISGSWIIQGDGQGALINIAEAGGTSVFVVSWYAYLNGEQVWMVGSKPIAANSTSITVPVQISNGTGFGQDFISDNLNRTNWGDLTFNFASCDSGTLQYSSNLPEYGSGSLALTRLTNTQGLNCQDSNNAGGSPAPSSTSLVGRNYDGITIVSEEIFDGTSTFSQAIAPGATACHLRLKIQNTTSENKSVLPIYGAYKAGQQVASATGINILASGKIPANSTTTVEALWTAITPNPGNNGACNTPTTPNTTTQVLSCSEIDEVRATLYSEILTLPGQ